MNTPSEARLPSAETPAKILLIDDEGPFAELFAERLQKKGFAVTIAGGGRDGMAKVATLQPDLVLLDMRMPDMSGLEFLVEIRKTHSKDSLPVIMLTSEDDTETIVKCFEAGANDYVGKNSPLAVVVARIISQLRSVELVKERIRTREVHAIMALVVSYNHEINNPLSTALGNLSRLSKGVDDQRIEKIERSLTRIRDVVGSIRDLGTKFQIEYDEYVSNQKMIRLRGREP